MSDLEGAVNGHMVLNVSSLAEYMILGPGPPGATLRRVRLDGTPNSVGVVLGTFGLVLTGSPAETEENYLAGVPLLQRSQSTYTWPFGEFRAQMSRAYPARFEFWCRVQAPEGAWYVLLGARSTAVLMFTTVSVRYTLKPKLIAMPDPGNTGDSLNVVK